MNIVHLTASPFLGGPERQMLGLADNLPATYRSVFLSFAEHGRARPFLEEARRRGYTAIELRYNRPRLYAVVRELVGHLRHLQADLLCCHGYKADLYGLLAARWAGVPVLAVSHGWTGATFKVRCYELLDKLCLHGMEAVVCVSAAQAVRVRRLGIPPQRVWVIRNALQAERLAAVTPAAARAALQELCPQPGRLLVGAAGRLSPEKGFDLLVEAAAQVLREYPETNFLIFGDGPLRAALARRITTLGLAERVLLVGFRNDLERLLPGLDLFVLSSYTEGLPSVVLEALAAAVPVVATAVGGMPEVVTEGVHGFLVPPGRADLLAERIRCLLSDPCLRRLLGQQGQEHVRKEFTFTAQARRYEALFAQLVRRRRPTARGPETPSVPVPSPVRVPGECGSEGSSLAPPGGGASIPSPAPPGTWRKETLES
jgi:glycosyltransferase involved in cell wall biosynthesis